MVAVLAAGSVHETEAVLFHTLFQLILIILAARVAGKLAGRLGQPQVVGEIIAGIALGPSLLGSLCPAFSQFAFNSITPLALNILSQIGLVLLMFQIGLEFDFSHLNEPRNRKAVILISTAGILCPFALGWELGGVSASTLSPDANRTAYQLFFAVALSITAVPILGRIMMEYRLHRTRIGAITITCAGLNDVAGWILLAVVSAFATSGFEPRPFLIRLGLLAAYIVFCWFAVRPFLGWLLRLWKIKGESIPHDLLAVVLSIVLASAMVTYRLGIFAITGGFIMGVLMHQHHDFVGAWRRNISDFVIVFFLPIFFTQTGLRTNIHGLDSTPLWGWFALVMFCATLGKFGGAWIASRMSGMSNDEACAVGIMMNTRALMELVVLNIGFELGILPQAVFTMLVLMAVLSTVVTGPALKIWLRRMGHSYAKEKSPSSCTADLN